MIAISLTILVFAIAAVVIAAGYLIKGNRYIRASDLYLDAADAYRRREDDLAELLYGEAKRRHDHARASFRWLP